MVTYELVNRKRGRTKTYAFIGFISGFGILALTALMRNILPEPLRIAMMIAVALIFIASLFIINYSYKFKVVIGHISFSNDMIEIEMFQRKETLRNEDIRKIRFRLTGYEGLNNSSIIGSILFVWQRFSYCSGLNNFVYIQTDRERRNFEFFIGNKKEWENIHRIMRYYHNKNRSSKTY